LKTELIIQYCLLTNKGEIFLKWIHSQPVNAIPITEGIKNGLIKCLSKWGGADEKTLLQMIHAVKPTSSRIIVWPDYDQQPLRGADDWKKAKIQPNDPRGQPKGSG
jgi:hypothetical protein